MLEIKCKGEKILKKKKIAVLSIYDLDNFGNRLQSVAVYKLLKKVNCEPEIVEIDKIGKKELISRLLKKTLRFSKINFESVRLPLFRKFNKNIKNSKYKIQWFLGKEVVDKGMDDAYDFFIVGSDQVWNPEFAGDGFYFLDFVKENKKKIAFSASVGVTDISKNYEDKMRLNLKKFNAVSVREQQANDLITSLTGRDDIVTLVDPTMMIDPSEWSKLTNIPPMYNGEKFILNYFLGNQSPERRKIIEDYAKKVGYKVINILEKDDPFYASGPAEFLWLEKNAELICTDSFHSSVFGILFNTPFLVFDREDASKNMSSRLDNLLRIFDLNDRKFVGKELADSYLNIDYSGAHEKLLSEKKRGLDFLINAIEGINK